jgi:hypothetical protein
VGALQVRQRAKTTDITRHGGRVMDPDWQLAS